MKSNERAANAIKDGRFADEITAVSVKQRRGEPILVDTDEGVRPGTTMESLAALRPEHREVIQLVHFEGLSLEEAAGRATSDDELLGLITRATDLGFTDVVLAWPRPTMPYQGDESRMERLAAELPALRNER